MTVSMKKQDCIIGVMDPNGFAFKMSFEKLIEYLNPEIKYGIKQYNVATRRLKARPYDVLNSESPYSAIINRGAHWNPHYLGYLMSIAPSETYMLNDMISFLAIKKNSSYAHMNKLGIRIPVTCAIPPQDYSEITSSANVQKDLFFEDNELFDLQEIGEEIGYPSYLKPQEGGGWVGVVKINNAAELIENYNKSGQKPMNLQKAVDFKEFVRSVGIGPQVIPMHYNPDAKYSHDRYLRSPEKAIEFNFLGDAEFREVTKVCKIINAFYGWDHNSCETLIDNDGTVYAIDFANAYPDSSLVSLHFYFPEVVKAMAKWMIFCAVTKRKKSVNFGKDWHKYYKIAEQELSYAKKLDEYDKIADQYYETDKFNKFCVDKLPDFEEKAMHFFSSDLFDDILVEEVKRYFRNTPHEIESKVAHYRGLHHFWIDCEKKKLGL